MKFNEKLIELRKKEGLSQEELGYKLNVTRQTVSKWELGQTTPEMDKLVEISKIFNVSVDELVNEKEEKIENETIIEDQPIKKEKNGKNNIILILVIGAVIAILIYIIVKIVAPFKVKDYSKDLQDNAVDNFFNIFNNATEKLVETQENIINNVSNTKEGFNENLEMFSGKQRGLITSKVLDKIITINKKGDKKIVVKYLEKETKNVEEIKNIKMKIQDNASYEISFEYDEEGFINKAIFEKYEEISEFDIKKFNSPLEIYSGSKMGGTIVAALDKIITSNKTENKKITIKYLNIETLDEKEIKNIKKEIKTFEKYDLSFDYDENGFINKATIEKL